jgi:phosphopantothenoylcysteine synthetase/decarboxylase
VTDATRRPVLYIAVCGGRPGSDLPAFVEHAQLRGWEVCVVATPSGLKFIDRARLAQLSGHVVRHDYKQPDEPDVLPPAEAIVVAPATFNTVNKWAAGVSDTLVLGLLNEAIGLQIPIVAVPWPNRVLARHPAYLDSVARLRSWGVTIIFDPEKYPLPVPDMGPPGNQLFPWHAAREELDRILSRWPWQRVV